MKERILRANDGAVDAKGRYWCGTMNDPEEKEPTNEGMLNRQLLFGTVDSCV